jgi:leukotriene-A4 hydrolase
MPSTMTKIVRDFSSLSNPHEIRVKHLEWNVSIDFDTRKITGEASYTFERLVTKCDQLCLDTQDLVIFKITDQDNSSLTYKLTKKVKAHLGSQLCVDILDSTTRITIHYQTTPASSACQWLPPAQTAGKVYPYLFTQCQAIHARSLFPCQDAPGVKMTYQAHVQVPEWAVCVMSALSSSSQSTPTATTRTFSFQQPVPVSSYLVALAVGHLEQRKLSERCAIWSEPAIVDAAAWEFAQTEDFLQTAEALAGTPYVWGRYDLLCLPPSFPYGGMENASN